MLLRHVVLLLTICLAAALGACGGGSEALLDDGRKQPLADSAQRPSAARTLFTASSFHGRLDLNADGRGDLLWYDEASGTTAAWLMDGARLIGGGDLLKHPFLRVAGTGDFNGDGKTDLVWHDAGRNETTLWLVDGAAAVQGRTVMQGHTPIGTPDLDGDGKSDLLWFQPSTGTTTAWLMDGTAVRAQATLLVHPHFRVVALPDLDGDGRTDLLWRDAFSGQTVAWIMDGLAFRSGALLLTNPGFAVTHTPDLNGDGRSDLIWRHPLGNTVVWLMNGLQFTGGRELLADGAYKVIGTADLNGDGKDDLIWFNASTGDSVLWIMDGDVLAGGGTLLRDPQFVPVYSDDINGDGRSDLLWYNGTTRSTAAWLSSSTGYQGLGLVAGSGFMPSTLSEARAGSFPAKAITIIVPTAAGGIADIVARDLAEALKVEFGQNVVISNVGGSGGTLATEAAARAAADGYTLFLGSINTHAFNVALFPTLAVDPIRAFTPLTRLATGAGALLTHPSRPFTTVQGLIAQARAQPESLVYGSGGTGTLSHLSGVLFESMTQVKLSHAPYRGTGPATVDLLSNTTALMFAGSGVGVDQVNSGKLRALAVTGTARLAAWPDVPTLAESGVPGYEAVEWYGLLAPVGTPAPVVAKLNAATVKVLKQPVFVQRLASRGLSPHPETPDAFAAHIKAETTKWGQVVRNAGVTLN